MTTVSYRAFSARVADVTRDLQLGSPSAEVIRNHLLNWSEDSDIECLASLGTPPAAEEWWSLTHRLPEGPVSCPWSPFSCADGFAEALSCALVAIDETRTRITGVEALQAGLRFLDADGEVLRIHRTEFAEVPRAMRDRVRGLFKNLLTGDAGDFARLAERLRTLKGFSSCAYEPTKHLLDRPVPPRSGRPPLSTPHNTAAIVREALRLGGASVSATQAQTITARAAGLRDWQVVAAAERERGPLGRPYALHNDDGVLAWYRCAEDGLWDLSRRLERTDARTFDLWHGLSFGLVVGVRTAPESVAELTLGRTDAVDAPESYRRWAQGFAGDEENLGGVAEALRRYLVGDSVEVDRQAASRKGIPPERCLQLQDWRFEIDLGDGRPEQRWLRAEQFDPQGRLVRRGDAALYKADLHRCGRAVRVMGNYENEVCAELPSFSDFELRQLQRFTGLRIQNRAFEVAT